MNTNNQEFIIMQSENQIWENGNVYLPFSSVENAIKFTEKVKELYTTLEPEKASNLDEVTSTMVLELHQSDEKCEPEFLTYLDVLNSYNNEILNDDRNFYEDDEDLD